MAALYNRAVIEAAGGAAHARAAGKGAGLGRRRAGLDATFAALADPTRRAILARLARGVAAVAELARPFAMSQPAISRHLKVLERAGLISRGREAQQRPRRLEPRTLKEVADWVERYRRFWRKP
jgi:DNA-binding transcriptional ArsR family regulator